jgi:predicted small lipoprotein YifL
MRAVLIGVAAAWLTAGCGQKGPLYLPDRTPTAVTAAPAPQPAQPGTTPQKKNDNDKDDSTQPPQ